MSNFLTILSPFLVAQLFRRAGQPGDRFGMIFSIALCLFGWTPVERRASVLARRPAVGVEQVALVEHRIGHCTCRLEINHRDGTPA
jgi:hypothetical protein